MLVIIDLLGQQQVFGFSMLHIDLLFISKFKQFASKIRMRCGLGQKYNWITQCLINTGLK